jgi:putative transposase
MILAHKITLKPNNKQIGYFNEAVGTARFAYNWALGQWQLHYSAYQEDNTLLKPSQFSLRKELNAIKNVEFPWMDRVTKCAPQMAIIQLGTAFQRFFDGISNYPNFKKKGEHDSFTISNDQFRIEGKKIRIPKLGWVRMRETLRFSGKILSATISKQADKWFVSITVETTPKTKTIIESQDNIGVDLGIHHLAVLSNGEKITQSPAVKKLLNKIAVLHRWLSRKHKGSHNYQKAKLKLARCYAKLANIRSDTIHKLTHSLTKRFFIIAIEDLNVKGMLKNSRLAKAISNMGFGEFKRQLSYKSILNGNQLISVDRWFSSSKTCSCCEYQLSELKLSQREWICPQCHAQHDRDINAAINLLNWAINKLKTTVSSTGNHACGEEGSGKIRKNRVKPSSLKQENNTEFGFS